MTLEDQLKEDTELILDALSKNINGLRTVAFNSVKADMSRRIFQNGTATDGSPIGDYAPATAKQRAKGGRQTGKVDLELTGELRRSFVVGEEGRQVVLGMVENTEPKVSIKGGVVRITGKTDYLTTENAIQQEKHFSKEIFAPSAEEVEKSEEVFLAEVDKLISKALGKSKTIRIKRS